MPKDPNAIPVLTFDDVAERLRQQKVAANRQYLAMYSSWLGGFVKDPALMMIPVDDHVVHRGDGVFEAVKCVAGRIFALRRHLDRLALSAKAIGLQLPHSTDDISEICRQAVVLSGASDVMIRIYASRGPGGFTANPYDSVGSQLYIVITAFKAVVPDRYLTGVRAGLSQVPIKEGFFPTVKSCNYLPNVLMKKEAVDRGLDFTISQSAEGFLAEGSTENFAIVSSDGELVVPSFKNTLRGVTLLRAMELAKGLRSREGRFKLQDVLNAREALLFGTTLDCLPVTEFEGHKINGGQVGPVAKDLLARLQKDMASGELATSI